MGIEVRCGCGQLVVAEGRYAGQHVQCPHCKASVAVPVAAAAAVPSPPPEKSAWDSETGRMWSIIGGFVLLVVLVGLYKGCGDDAEKERPSMKEIMQKARDKNR